MEEIAAQANSSYPTDYLVGSEKALILFAAGFYGGNDGYWIANYGLEGTCVDIDSEKLALMRKVYPESWQFVRCDVFDYALAVPKAVRFDVISVDPPIALIERSLEWLPTWMTLARKVVIHTVLYPIPKRMSALPGWQLAESRARNAVSAWLVWTKT